jgi:hypothetical protein
VSLVDLVQRVRLELDNASQSQLARDFHKEAALRGNTALPSG